LLQGGRATNLDFSLVVQNLGGNRQAIVCQGKIVRNEMFCCSSFKCLCKTTILDFKCTVSCASDKVRARNDLFAGVYMYME